eukprot:4934784-Pyramimonas_sp.AAC.1
MKTPPPCARAATTAAAIPASDVSHPHTLSTFHPSPSHPLTLSLGNLTGPSVPVSAATQAQRRGAVCWC